MVIERHCMEPIQTRIPAFLWDSLQNVFYQQDYEFLRQVSYLIKVPIPELKRTILGTKGVLTTVQVAKENTWWENQKCPLRVRSPQGLWKQCCNFREAHGFCGDHKGWTEKKATRSLKHVNDPYFQTLKRRKPFEYEGDIVWVSEEGDVVDNKGAPISGIRINVDAGIILPEALIEYYKNAGS